MRWTTIMVSFVPILINGYKYEVKVVCKKSYDVFLTATLKYNGKVYECFRKAPKDVTIHNIRLLTRPLIDAIKAKVLEKHTDK